MEVKFEKKTLFDTIVANIQKVGTKNYACIPVQLLYVDPDYQRIMTRSKRKIQELVNNWDPSQMDPLKVVIHKEECCFAIVDGFGRWTASQQLPIPLDSLDCNIILDVPKNKKERKRFEARLFAHQSDSVERVRPAQMHNANVLLGVDEYLWIDDVCKKYDIEISKGVAGRVAKGVLGNYSRTLRIAKTLGYDCLDYIFRLICESRWNLERDGFSGHIVDAIANMWAYHPNDRKEIYTCLLSWMKNNTPNMFSTLSKGKYPSRAGACYSLYFEDMLVNGLQIERVYTGDKTRRTMGASSPKLA